MRVRTDDLEAVRSKWFIALRGFVKKAMAYSYSHVSLSLILQQRILILSGLTSERSTRHRLLFLVAKNVWTSDRALQVGGWFFLFVKHRKYTEFRLQFTRQRYGSIIASGSGRCV